jgi:15-cis-phytoene synthase
MVNLEECYELCRTVQRSHSRTYYFSTRLFPPEIRRHVHALYAFTRYADEIVDDRKEGVSAGTRLEALEAFETETMLALASEEVGDPILRAFASTAREHGIGQDPVRSFIRSMKMDTYMRRYPTYEDLEEYMYGSAAVVGTMMCRILGVEEEEALPHAEALGEAMQLTNFLRDVREDWERGRVYLPLEDLKRFGYSEENLGMGRVNEAFVELMRFEIDRARMLYLLADQGVHYIPRGRRYPVLVARHLYAAILERIEELGYDVFSSRAGTTFAEKLQVAAACAVREPGEILARGANQRITTA